MIGVTTSLQSAGSARRRVVEGAVVLYEPKRILVVVKTYPNPSRSHGETVCCAGVDLETGRWIRMYPITFRRLADRRFKKYQLIDCLATRPRGDSRPESLRIDQDSIKLVGNPVSTANGWQRRMTMLPEPSASLEGIKGANEAAAVSIGMFPPKAIRRLVKEPADPWTEKERAALRQEHLGLGEEQTRQLSELQQIPWKFSYAFDCDADDCVGHKLQILDWELGESFRRWSRSNPSRWEEMMRQKYERELPARDLHLVVGTLAAHPKTFVIIGLVYPPRTEMHGAYVQETLDLMRQERAVTGKRVSLEAEKADALAGDHGDQPLELFSDEI
jgi:hypothetical protein